MDSVALYDSGFRRMEGVKVTSYADAATKSIFVKLPRSAVAGGPAGGANLGAGGKRWNIIVALLSHDGYSPGGVRPVKATREQWALGGCDQEALCPNIIDLVVGEAGRQEAILGAYRSTGAPVEIPGVGVLIP